MMKSKLLRFTDIYKETIWGGQKILPFKGLPGDGRNIGESWEISGVPGDESIVADGEYSGLTLTELLEQEKGALVGEENYRRYGNKFPLLVKFIDACQPLSVQVHPNDELAMARHRSMGKTEMWYIVDCDENATLYDGFNRDITEAEYVKRVEEQTLPEVLQCYNVSKGDVFYLPAGRVHSIGKGCFICEIQQSSDLTYRIYDFGRLDANGRPRQLHIEQAKEAIDFSYSDNGETPKVVLNEPTTLVEAPYFTTGLYRLTEPMSCDYSELDSFVILICTSGSCRVICKDEEVILNAGHSLLVAAEAEGVMLLPDGKCDILETYV